MLYADILYGEGEGLLVVLLFLLLLLAGEWGFRHGRSRRARIDEHTRSQTVTIQGAILGLLGLLLGFTFAMAVSRFDSRKQLMVDEANAIGTAVLRARLLPEQERKEVIPLMQRYVEARIELTRTGTASPSGEERTQRVARLQDLLWAQAVAATEKDRRAAPTVLFVRSLNDVFDAAGRRDAALENHVPVSVLVLLAFVAALSVGVVGYGCGLGGGRTFFPILALAVSIAVVVLLIVDLDRPRRGLVRVSEKSMLDLKQSLDRVKP
jgi:hypothetical protein